MKNEEYTEDTWSNNACAKTQTNTRKFYPCRFPPTISNTAKSEAASNFNRVARGRTVENAVTMGLCNRLSIFAGRCPEMKTHVLHKRVQLSKLSQHNLISLSLAHRSLKSRTIPEDLPPPLFLFLPNGLQTYVSKIVFWHVSRFVPGCQGTKVPEIFFAALFLRFALICIHT